MAKYIRNTLLLAKLQTQSGTEATPAAASDALLIRNVTATPLSMETAERELLRPYFGNSGTVVTSQYGQLEFEIELAASGAVATAPAWGKLLRACGFSETTTPTVDVRYSPVSNNIERLTLHYWLDGLLHKLIDARGTVSVELTAKAIPVLKFRFIGAYQPITDGVAPTGVDYNAFKTPSAVNKANTPSWSLGTYTGCLQSFSFDVANSLIWRSLVACEGAEVSDRKPTGKLVLELPSISSLNWPQMILSASNQTLSLTHGVGDGNVITFNLPAVQLTNPTYSDDNGVAMLNLDLNVQPGTQGNDEIEIVLS